MAGKDVKKGEPTKAELQARMEQTRESISETVEEIKDTVAHQYETVKDTYETVKESVSEVIDWREHFSRNPIVWGAGAVSLGILVGLGLAHSIGDMPSSSRRRKSGQAALNESLLSNVSRLSEVVLPTMTGKIKEMFGIDLSEYLGASNEAARTPVKRVGAKKRAAKKTGARKSSTKKGSTKKGHEKHA
jgi:hypothetical protein